MYLAKIIVRVIIVAILLVFLAGELAVESKNSESRKLEVSEKMGKMPEKKDSITDKKTVGLDYFNEPDLKNYMAGMKNDIFFPRHEKVKKIVIKKPDEKAEKKKDKPPQPAKAEPESKQLTEKNYRLYGIINVSGNKYALINSKMVAEGETIGPVKVKLITPESVYLVLEDESLVLKLKE